MDLSAKESGAIERKIRGWLGKEWKTFENTRYTHVMADGHIESVVVFDALNLKRMGLAFTRREQFSDGERYLGPLTGIVGVEGSNPVVTS
ncbi:MAG: hypothetical protein ACRDPE_23500 [Solirubrobacterales bacterium]